MKCLETGIIQAYIDGELDIALRKEAELHLLECEKCSSRANELKSNDNFAFDKISEYQKYIGENLDKHNKVFKAPNNQISIMGTKKGVFDTMLKYKKIAVIACSVLVAATCITVQPVRAAITNALSIFRVENVKGLKISLEDINSIQNQLSQKQSEINMDKLGRISTTGGETRQLSLDEAKNIADMPVLLPTALDKISPEIRTTESSVMEFTLNVGYVNEALKLFGGTKNLPSSLDGKTFKVSFSRQLSFHYNLKDKKSFDLMQTKTPALEVPEGVDMDELYNSLVGLPLLPPNLQSQLKSIKDWKSTLYIPMVDSETEEIDVNGNAGYLYSKSYPDKGVDHSGLIWSSNGTIYTAGGNISKEELLKIVRSMR